MLHAVTHMLSVALNDEQALPSHMLHAMNAKLGRRLLKLGTDVDKKVAERVQEVMRKAGTIISQRWSTIQKQDAHDLDLSRLPTLDFENDSRIYLPTLDNYITAMKLRQPCAQGGTRFHPTSQLIKFAADHLPNLSSGGFADKEYTGPNLQGVEDWIVQRIQTWSSTNIHDGNICSDIGSLLKSYHSVAQSSYSGNPETLSIMILTICELWVANDIAAVALYPLLGQYDPGLTSDALHNLHLPTKRQMERLHAVEEYLVQRRSVATLDFSALLHTNTPSCFAAKYFDTSSKHQSTLTSIEAKAELDKTRKLEDFRKLKQEYSDLMQKHASGVCDTQEIVVDTFNGLRETRHSSNCVKCAYKKRAEQLEISVHEWPVPTDRTKAKAIVFELQVPAQVSSWRDTTFYLLTNVLQAEYSISHRPRAAYPLASDPHLTLFAAQIPRSQRVGLLSEDKPHVRNHRNTIKISTSTEQDVCVRNGLKYRYYDADTATFTAALLFTEKVPEMCTYRLPQRSSILQKYLYRPAAAPEGPPPNSVIANQSECPDYMALDEFKHLARLPLGSRLQWHNILIELAAPSIDLRRDETALFVYQCIYQAGSPAVTQVRGSHMALNEDHSASRFVEVLNTAMQRVKGNWESAPSLGVFAALAARLLTLTTLRPVEEACLEFLNAVRSTAFGWVQLLRNKAQQACTQEDRAEFQSKSVDVALICASSYDVDDRHLPAVLSAQVGSILIQCSIIIHEGKPADSSAIDPVLTLLQQRFGRLLFRAYPLLEYHAVDDAISKAWPAFRSRNGWTPGSAEHPHWITTDVAASGGTSTLAVHYNLLSGELLVNGLPLGRPPGKYELHPLFPVLFGNSAVEVVPSPVAGMELSARRTYHGCEVHLRLDESGPSPHLIVRASTKDSTYETIPARLFRGEFPEFYVDNFVHWINIADGTIEFRPTEEAWNRHSASTWRLSKLQPSLNSIKWQLLKDDFAVIGSRNDTATEIGRILTPLAELSRIHAILEGSNKRVRVDILTLQLGFSLEPGSVAVQSREFRGMSVDEDQSLGTLVGFSNKLLLRSATHTKRMVLLPEGRVSYKATGSHVRVTVDKPSITKVHPLDIDLRLGRLVDNGSFQGKLFVAYLHALTAFCLPDPLLQRTGTEQALTTLNSAAIRSFAQLSEENVSTLLAIAALTPTRCYYPAHATVMQTVSSRPSLSFFAQHNHFRKAVTMIFDQADVYNLFYPGSGWRVPEMSRTDLSLTQRATVRTATFRVAGYGAEDHTAAYDASYYPRDANHDSSRRRGAHVLSSLIFGEHQARQFNAQQGYLWNALRNAVDYLNLGYRALLVDTGLDLNHWLALHKAIGDQGNRLVGRFQFMMWISALAAAQTADMAVLQTLVLLFTSPSVRGIPLPTVDVCYPAEGYEATQEKIRSIVHGHLIPLQESPEAKLPKQGYENRRTFQARQKRVHGDKQQRAVEFLVQAIHQQWPVREFSLPNLSNEPVALSQYIRVNQAFVTAAKKFKLWFDNLQLFKYTQRIEEAISVLPSLEVPTPIWPTTSTSPLATPRSARFVSAQDVFASSAPAVPRSPEDILRLISSSRECNDTFRLCDLIRALRQSSCRSDYEFAYINELERSLVSLQARDSAPRLELAEKSNATLQKTLLEYLRACASHLDNVYTILESSVKLVSQALPQSAYSSCLLETAYGPRLSPIDAWKKLPPSWKPCIVRYGLAFTALQRAQRLVKAVDNLQDLVSELQNVGHTNWDPFDYPETLLLEVESGILVRDIQEQIAAEMRTPQTGENRVMQLNMGEGKSSVIVPMVAAALADSKQLVRVVVAKPQSKQMSQMLISKLGGLLGRRIYYLPFSRALKMDTAAAKTVDRMLRGCMSDGGILLVQPEHILSFKLMGIECYNAGKPSVGQSLLLMQDMFDSCSRDILDESDENLSVKFELTYTIGTQQPIELTPLRWICVHQVLELVRQFAAIVANDLPKSVELTAHHKGGFPRVRILQSCAEERLVSLVARQICERGLDGFPIARQPKQARDAVYKYITDFNLADEDVRAVEEPGPRMPEQAALAADLALAFDVLLANGNAVLRAESRSQQEKPDSPSEGFFTASTEPTLYLLRGLLAGGVLGFTLGQKRWRVNYGLAAARTPPTKLAVPYRSKDSPTARSEFSHPDVVIVLTSLCYYYDGLCDDDLFTAFEHLMVSDQADVEYDSWIRDAPDLPLAFRQLEGINLRDRPQCVNEIFPYLRYGKSVVDYHLAHIVFPKEMKQFPYKLSASGWDIAKNKTCLTTGFSGTKDFSKLLPLDIAHLDLPEQRHTNALVLEYLLDPDNAVITMQNRSNTIVSDAEYLLETVMNLQPPVRVILDPGALVLELNNQQFAQQWLAMHLSDEVKGVVFVNGEDEITVLDRHGRIESLQTSPFATQLDLCLVFLDEAHTRGIDLKLPLNYRAAVTLGANLTKDALVQACMRMRKLGKGQTVVFCVSEEIEYKIRSCTAKSRPTPLGLDDVLHWAIAETFTAIRRAVPLWAVQGERFLRQSKLWGQVTNNGRTTMSLTHSENFLETEAQSLEHRYRPNRPTTNVGPIVDLTVPRVEEIVSRCHEFDQIQFSSSTLQEEQERELSPEIEQEKQVERPPTAQPEQHSVHAHVRRFALKGVIVEGSTAYKAAFHALQDTSAAQGFPLAQLALEPQLLVTADFASTIKKSGNKSSFYDAYQRPVQWILTCANKTNAVTSMMIISPFEAQSLLPSLSAKSRVTLHLYKPRCNASHRAFDSLDFLTIPARDTAPLVPRLFLVQLNLFAGQLYLTTYQDYLETCAFLGLAVDQPKNNELIDADGYILRGSDGQYSAGTSPVKFLQLLMSKIRRNGQSIAKTPVGSMLAGKLLARSDFEG
ncbi:hypothetical protein LTR37_003430 [Vermiconidia calcicola]|uniref:Uncharacterized protein n=1 Tax=Vermiconidia calcicola TaxID=1690605 RepID=A0ACC3NQ84_9PEZI|nr:hypothetical protein LTR37_003430 [Vermiconidia calcicola]